MFMSQHSFDAIYQGQPVSIMMGWDVSTQSYFMVIEVPDEDEPIYSNLDDIGVTQDLSYYQGVLKRLGLSVPSQMLEEIAEDAKNNIQNKCVGHEITESGEYYRF